MELQELKGYLIESSFPMLGAEEGLYISGTDTLFISDMETSHLKHSIKYLKDREKTVTQREVGFITVSNEKNKEIYFDNKETIIELYYAKIKELEDEYLTR